MADKKKNTKKKFIVLMEEKLIYMVMELMNMVIIKHGMKHLRFMKIIQKVVIQLNLK